MYSASGSVAARLDHGDGVADPRLANVLDPGDEVADLADTQARGRIGSGEMTPTSSNSCLVPVESILMRSRLDR